MWHHPLVQLAFLALTAWVGLQLVLRFLGGYAVLALLVVCTLAAVALYLLRFHPEAAGRVYRTPGGRQFLDLVCWLTAQQPPVTNERPEHVLALREPRDFEWAKVRLKEAVWGHDAAIDVMMDRLQQNVLLRGRRAATEGEGPLGVFLLVGSDGIGKRFLAEHLGRRLYQGDGLTVLRLDESLDDAAHLTALFGGPGQEGQLLSAAKRRPYHTFVLENVEHAGAKVLERLQEVFTAGRCPDPTGSTWVRFQHCLFLLTTTRMPAAREGRRAATANGNGKHRAAVEALSAETALSRPFLAHVHEVLFLHAPDDLTKARVFVQLMHRECHKFRMTLEYVDPEILVDEVTACTEPYGFALSEARIVRRLRGLLARAAEHDHARLVLTRDLWLGDD